MHIPIILKTLEWLLGCQGARGNWPTAGPTSSAAQQNKLLQWVSFANPSQHVLNALVCLAVGVTVPLHS